MIIEFVFTDGHVTLEGTPEELTRLLSDSPFHHDAFRRLDDTEARLESLRRREVKDAQLTAMELQDIKNNG